MGFTPLDGIVMETRSGAVDPGLLLFLLRDASCTPDKLEHILNFDSGLKGLSGLSGDMREILATRESGNADAVLAFNVWLHRLCAGIAGMCASLRGLDALVFTGGVGENSAVVRAAACERLAFLGVRLAPGLNASTKKEDRQLSHAGSAVRAFVIHTREEWEMARECSELLSASQT
jgi:acetate kinase